MMRLLALLLSLLSVANAMTPAGTVIRNQAKGMVGGEVYLSNPVETRVLPLCVPLLSPDGTPQSPGLRATVYPGGVAYLPYQLQNGGNDAFTFALSVAFAGDWIPTRVRIFHDLNVNGLLDPGEPEVNSLRLAPGERAALILELQAPMGASGSSLLSPVAACQGGGNGVDGENWAEVRASPAALFLSKGVTPSPVHPGEEVVFTLEGRNLGGVDVQAVLEDLLNLEGLSYVPGSARASLGVLEYFDGAAWSPSEPPTVLGLRVKADLPVGGSVRLTFRMKVAPDARPGVRANRATLEGGGGVAQAEAGLEVLPLYRHHLGPLGNPKALPGGEESLDDEQSATLLAGQPYCFRHTLLNEGTVSDRYEIYPLDLPSGVTVAFFKDGLPLSQPIPLDPGKSLDFEACLTAQDAQAFRLVLVAKSLGGGGENRTTDRVVVKPASALSLVKEASPPPGITLKPGDTITYRLRIQNDYAPLPNALVEDPLPQGVEFLEASPGGVYTSSDHTVRFSLNLLLGETSLWIRVKVKDLPDDTLLENAFLLRSPSTPNPIRSNPVRHPVFNTALLLKKEVTPEVVGVGERLLYRLEVSNPSRVPLTVRLVDAPDRALEYIPGTARIKPGCQGEGEAREPSRQGDMLVWEGLPLDAGGRVCLEYGMRLLRPVRAEIVNLAQAFGLSEQGAATASAQAKALARVRIPVEEKAVILGRVYLDVDGDGRYTPGVDLPLPGARVLLANGWQTLTDQAGRYAFRDLRPGTYQVMLDPESAPFPPLPHPQALGEGYRRGVEVYGLTQVDYPLKVPKGRVEVQRETTLLFGPLRLEKRLVRVESRFMVQILLKTSQPLPEFTLRDGGEEWRAEVLEGEEGLLFPYRGEFTDPEVRWRYP